MDARQERQARRLYPIEEARQLIGGVSRATFYELVKSGRIAVVHIGRRTFVEAGEIARFIASLAGDAR